MSQTSYFDICKIYTANLYQLSLLPNVFQNQESIPSNGAVKSYFVQVSVYNNPYGLLVPINAQAAQSIAYSFNVAERPTHGPVSSVATTVLILCLAVVIVCLVLFVWIMLEEEARKLD